MGSDLPEGVTYATLHTVELTGTFTPRASGPHTFGIKGTGPFTLTVDGTTYYDDDQRAGQEDPSTPSSAPRPPARGSNSSPANRLRSPHPRRPIPEDPPDEGGRLRARPPGPQRDPDELIAEAVEASRGADTAVVMVATTDRVESEGFDRRDLEAARPPGRPGPRGRRRQPEHRRGRQLRLPGRTALAQRGRRRPADLVPRPGGRRRPRRRPHRRARARRAGSPPPGAPSPTPRSPRSSRSTASCYSEGVFIGYRAWERAGRTPSYPFGHGLG